MKFSNVTRVLKLLQAEMQRKFENYKNSLHPQNLAARTRPSPIAQSIRTPLTAFKACVAHTAPDPDAIHNTRAPSHFSTLHPSLRQ